MSAHLARVDEVNPTLNAAIEILRESALRAAQAVDRRRAAGEPLRLSRKGEALHQGFALGGFAEKALIHENQLVKVPNALPFPQAALIGCGVMTGAGSVLTPSTTTVRRLRSSCSSCASRARSRPAR